MRLRLAHNRVPMARLQDTIHLAKKLGMPPCYDARAPPNCALHLVDFFETAEDDGAIDTTKPPTSPVTPAPARKKPEPRPAQIHKADVDEHGG